MTCGFHDNLKKRAQKFVIISREKIIRINGLILCKLLN